MLWHQYLIAAVQELHPGASPVFDFHWVKSDLDADPEMAFWNEEKLGPLDLEALQVLAEAISQRQPVPSSVTPAQAQTVLDDIGLLEQLEEAIGAHPYSRVRIWFRSALRWDRNHPYVDALALELGLDSDQVDDLFRAAARVAA